MAGNQFFSQYPQSYQMPPQQPLFPQPQGNVYFINNSVEVANVPMGGGISVAICMNEGVMYVKSLQNGQPTFMAYSIIPYLKDDSNQQESKPQLEEKVDKIESKLVELEKLLTRLKGGNLSDLL